MTSSENLVEKAAALYEGNTRRDIDLHAGDDVNAAAFKALILAAAALNKSPAR